MYLMIQFLYIELKNIIVSDIFFSNSTIISLLPVPQLHAFLFVSNTFVSNARLKSGKNQVNTKQTPKLNFCYLNIIQNLHPRYHPKTIDHVLKINKRTSPSRHLPAQS